MNLDPRLLRLAQKTGLLLGLTITAGFVSGLLVLLQSWQLSQILSAVFLDHADRNKVFPWLFALLGIFLARPILAWMGEILAANLAVRVKTSLREQLIDHLLKLGPSFTAGEQSGELATAAVQGVEELDAYYRLYLPQLALAALVPLAILVVVFPLDLLSGLVLLLTAPLIPIFMILIGKAAESVTRRQWMLLSRLSAYFLDSLQGLTTLKLFGQQDRAGRIEQVSERYREATLSVLRITFLSAFVLELVATISTAVLAVEIGLRLLYARMTFQQAIFILLIAPEFYLPLRNLGLRFHAAISGSAAAKRVFELLNIPVPQPSGSDLVKSSLSLEDPISIRFDRVSFRYIGRDAVGLEEVSFAIHPGEQIALVGASGAGKSTVAQLLLGFQKPESGEIWVNDLPLLKINPGLWRQKIAWVPQRPYLLNDSIAANIRMAKPSANLEEIRQAARLADLDEFISNLPQGYETSIGELGTQLSGGQAQRLALARAFLRDASLLILDEPTAHLDSIQEQALVQTIRRLCEGRSSLIIAHRLPTVIQADRILVLEEGRIIEQGAHEQLIQAGGLYSQWVLAYGGVS